MNPTGNPVTLDQARCRNSLDKRQRTLTPRTRRNKDHLHRSRPRRRSPTWLAYTPGIREHIEAAQRRQHVATTPARPGDPHTTPVALRIELDLARQEIRQLRARRDRLSTAVRHQLGQQLDTFTAGDLTARVDELTQGHQQLTDQLRHAAAENTTLRERLTTTEADLTAARTSLRRMIRTENTAR